MHVFGCICTIIESQGREKCPPRPCSIVDPAEPREAGTLRSARTRPGDELAIRATRAAADCAARQTRWVLAATILASVIAYTDESVVNVALPAIARGLATSVAVVQWVVNAY